MGELDRIRRQESAIEARGQLFELGAEVRRASLHAGSPRARRRARAIPRIRHGADCWEARRPPRRRARRRTARGGELEPRERLDDDGGDRDHARAAVRHESRVAHAPALARDLDLEDVAARGILGAPARRRPFDPPHAARMAKVVFEDRREVATPGHPNSPPKETGPGARAGSATPRAAARPSD